MVYNNAALERRRCTATTTSGGKCRAWALWDDPRQVCASHSGRPRRPYGLPDRFNRPRKPTPTCRCSAYNWPHRPGGGCCRWPLPPTHYLTTPAGTHSYWRRR